jgi:hypothetical protein
LRHLLWPLPTATKDPSSWFTVPGEPVPGEHDSAVTSGPGFGHRDQLQDTALKECRKGQITDDAILAIGERVQEVAWAAAIEGRMWDWARRTAAQRTLFVKAWRPVLDYFEQHAHVLESGPPDQESGPPGHVLPIPENTVRRAVQVLRALAEQGLPTLSDRDLPPARRRGTPADRFRGPRRGPRSIRAAHDLAECELRKLRVPQTARQSLLRAWSLMALDT